MTALESLLDQVQERADAALGEVLAPLFNRDLFYVYFYGACRKCTKLLMDYRNMRQMETRWKREYDRCDYPTPENYQERLIWVLNRVETAREAFHSAECTCGLQLWRGQEWRDKQSWSYQQAYSRYLEERRRCS